MPIFVDVDHGRKQVNSLAVGPVSYEDVKNHLLMERYFNGLRYRELIDARGAGISLSPPELRHVVELLRDLGQSSKLGPTAVLVDNDVAFGAMRMLEELTKDLTEIEPFRTEEEARRWLASR